MSRSSRLQFFTKPVALALLFFASPRFLHAQQSDSVASAPTAHAVSHVRAEKLGLTGVPNAGNVDGILFRGAQPHGDGYQQLKHLGIDIVVDLHNTGFNQSAERKAVEAQGMKYVSLPASGIRGPSDDQVAQFLKLFRDNPGKKVFVHCKVGADRTGVMVAAYRMTQHQWTYDEAYGEMLDFHFHTFLLPMGSYVRSFPQRFTQQPAFVLLRPAPLSAAAPAN
jgi:protein tyrosine/serine phosphatase